MKRTKKGYETDKYYVNRHIGENIFTGVKSVDYWIVINKKTGKEDVFYSLGDAREYVESKQRKDDLINRDLEGLQTYINVMQGIANGTNDQKWMYGACIEQASYWLERLKEDVIGEYEE